MSSKYTVAGYIRVSESSQVEGHSLDAQERLIRELCRDRGWELVGVYREEGKSAHVDSINNDPFSGSYWKTLPRDGLWALRCTASIAGLAMRR